MTSCCCDGVCWVRELGWTLVVLAGIGYSNAETKTY